MSECRCMAWHHPLWAVIGKPAGMKPIAVWGIVCALRDDPILQQLGDKDRVAVLAEGAGLKPIQVALVLAGLEARGVLDADGRFAAAGWLSVSDGQTLFKTQDDFKTVGKTRLTEIKTPDGDHERELRAARNRRYYLRRKVGTVGIRPVRPAEIKTLAPSYTPAPLEEERDISLLSEEAREPDARAVKRRRLYDRAVEAAPRMLSEREYRWFIDNMTDERFERFLARGTGALPPRLGGLLERLFGQTQWRGSQPRPDPKQPGLMLPIAGSGGRRQERDGEAYRERRLAG